MILILSFFICSIGNAETISFKCTYNFGKEDEYISINKKKQIITRASTSYRIFKVTDSSFQAKNQDIDFENIFVFNRYSGEAQLQIYKKKLPGESSNLVKLVNYKCKKIEKLI